MLKSDLENIWNKQAAGLVYCYFLRKNANPESFEAFKDTLIKINDLHLPEDEKSVFDNCAWQIGKLVFELKKSEATDYRKIDELFEIIRDFHFIKPSDSYSFLFKAFHKGYQNWSNYLAFADWWNFDNLRTEDYLRKEFNGKMLMSLAEQAYIAYAKKLLQGESIDPFGQQREIDEVKIRSFLPKLDALIDKHPEYQYPPYFKAKLLLALGNNESALSAFLPFAKQKRNDFWVWELLAEMLQNDREKQFACYCKALSLRTPDEYLVKLRQKFVEMLIEKKMYNEAKTEIEKIIQTREKQKWKLPNQIIQWKRQEWYQSAQTKKDNQDLYLSYIKQAEEILFQDIPEEIVVVEFVNENKGVLNFVKDKRKFGFFKYAGHLTKPQIGDLLKVRFNGNGQNGFYKILTVKKVESNVTCEAIKNFEGTIKVICPHKYGFVGDIFIEPKIIEERTLIDGQLVKGRAMLSFNKNKNEWGWKAIEIK